MKLISKGAQRCTIALLLLSFSALSGTVGSRQSPTPKVSSWPNVAYAGTNFDLFVRDSFKVVGFGKPEQFYSSMEMGIESYYSESMNSFINRQRGSIFAAKGLQAKRDARVAACAEIHRMVKRTVPYFSLTRGFEFANLTQFGERQCFLQSVLIAGVLQRCDIDAGVVMVYQNPVGASSNLGHCVTLVSLSGDEHVLVDASAATPFVAQKGIFTQVKGEYLFIRPEYSNEVFIKGYRQERFSPLLVPISAVRPTELDFLKSMFEFYRGERAIDGVISKKPSKAGLKASIAHLRKSVKFSRSNPVAIFMLALALEKQGKSDQWKYFYRSAEALYKRSGWVPSTVTAGVERARKEDL